MALKYPACFNQFRTKAVEAHAQIERLTLARHNGRHTAAAQGSALLTETITKMRDVLEELEEWAIQPPEGETE